MQSKTKTQSKRGKQMRDDSSNDNYIPDQTELHGTSNLVWSRVVSNSQSLKEQYEVFSVGQDLNFAKQMSFLRTADYSQESGLLFDPDCYLGMKDKLKLSNYELPVQQQFQKALDSIIIRKQIQKNAYEQMSCAIPDHPITLSHVEVQEMRLLRKHQLRNEKHCQHEPTHGIDETFYHSKRKMRRFNKIKLDEIQIIQELLDAGNLTGKEIALKFGVKPQVIYSFSYKLKKDPNYVLRLQQQFDSKLTQRQATFDTINQCLKTGSNIWTMKQLKDMVAQQQKIIVPSSTIAQVTKDICKLRYKRVVKIPFQGNSDRCLIQRQQYALKMLDILKTGKRIINIDETVIPELDFRRRKWKADGQVNSIKEKTLSQRISMIAAIDTQGNAYFSLSQSNTNSETFRLFLHQLCSRLSKEDSQWRSNTVLLLDGAPYHKSKETKNEMKRLKLKVILSAPYSYDAAPVELFFAALKKVDLNPENIAIGKRTFSNMIQLIHTRTLGIEKSSIILMWHRATLNLFKYLNFARL